MKLTIDTQSVNRKICNFWNHIHFHPTDAIEDPWGKRILDRVGADKAAETVRMYTMFEDIVTMDEEGKLCFDFRLTDLRLDYMVEKGFHVLLSYNFIPNCIASIKNATASNSKGKTRYKGKLINTSPPTDYKLWEEICYEYTKHIVERYGEERVAKWYLQCYNEPDHPGFMMRYLPGKAENIPARLEVYKQMYKSFENAIRKVSTKLCVGGPALAGSLAFLEGFLNYVQEEKLQLDFISVHNYAKCSPESLDAGTRTLSIELAMEKTNEYMDVIRKCHMQDKKLVIDEWGASCGGFCDLDSSAKMIFRENEIFSAYYFKLIDRYLKEDMNLDKMLICLSGQHEMEIEFTGFRGMFTLNNLPKPIYNGYCLAAKLGDTLLNVETGSDTVSAIATLDGNRLVVALVNAKTPFDAELPDAQIELELKNVGNIQSATAWTIDSNHANGYGAWCEMGKPEIDAAVLKELRERSRLAPEKLPCSLTQSVTLKNNGVKLLEFTLA